MRKLQEEIMVKTFVQAEIDVEFEAQRRIEFLCDYLRKTGAKGFVLGISGGVDSSCAGRLAQLAVEKLRTEGHTASFIAVRLPYKIQADEADAQAALDFIQADRVITFNIGMAVDDFESEFDLAMGEKITDFNKGNIKARLRMVAQYAIGGAAGLLVIGTDQAAENTMGFFTKYGDGGADLLPLFGLNKRQVRALCQYLGADERVYAKLPTADLLDQKPGQLDEVELGLSYAQIDDYLEGKEVPDEIAEKIENIYLKTRHKRELPVTLYDQWWRN